MIVKHLWYYSEYDTPHEESDLNSAVCKMFKGTHILLRLNLCLIIEIIIFKKRLNIHNINKYKNIFLKFTRITFGGRNK